MIAVAAMLIVPGFIVEGPRQPLDRADAIVVISGDQDLARFREGLRLYQSGWAPQLIFSGAAEDGHHSNADAMRQLAVAQGVPPHAILVEPHGEDTLGNAVHTRDLMLRHDLESAILVTSPYHLHRASLTFQAAFQGTGVRVIGWSAPDSLWRKLSWWAKPGTRALTVRELEKLGYIALTGRFN